MKRNLVISFLALAMAFGGCADTSQSRQEPTAAEKGLADAREKEIAAFREKVNAINDPDKVLEMRSGHGRYSQEVTIVDERLHDLVSDKIKGAQSKTELRALKKYVTPGGNIMIAYVQRESELLK